MTEIQKPKIRLLPLCIALAIPLLAGGISAFWTAGDMKLYETMKHPPLAPPGWLFPVVWTILYIMMGVASYQVFTAEVEPKQKRKALTVYAVQLLMNMVWSTLFFTYTRYLLALIWLLIMWVIIFLCIIRFWKIRRSAAVMMCVLFVWTTFAAYLNLATYVISR